MKTSEILSPACRRRCGKVKYRDSVHISSAAQLSASTRMSKTKQTNTDAGHQAPSSPKGFPDLATCRVKDTGFYLACLGFLASQCPYCLGFGSGQLCRHPEAPEILAHSEGKNCTIDSLCGH